MNKSGYETTVMFSNIFSNSFRKANKFSNSIRLLFNATPIETTLLSTYLLRSLTDTNQLLRAINPEIQSGSSDSTVTCFFIPIPRRSFKDTYQWICHKRCSEAVKNSFFPQILSLIRQGLSDQTVFIRAFRASATRTQHVAIISKKPCHHGSLRSISALKPLFTISFANWEQASCKWYIMHFQQQTRICTWRL